MLRSTAKEVRKLLRYAFRRLSAPIVEIPIRLRMTPVVVLGPLVFRIIIRRVAPTSVIMRRNVGLAPISARVEKKADRRI